MSNRIPLALAAAALLTTSLTACSTDQASTTAAGTSETSGTSATGTTTVAVAAGSASADVLADNAEVHASALEYDEAEVREVTLSGTSATSEAEGVTIDGATVTLTEPGTYRLTGTLTDGQVIVDSPSDGLVQVILAGTAITSSTTAALAIAAADEAVILLAEGTTNSLVDATEYVYPDEAPDEPNAALFSAADLTIAGAGSLTVRGNANDGIASKDGLVIASGTITVDAVDDGIRGKDYVVLDGGEVTVTAGGDALKADNAEDADKGFIVVRDGTLTATSGDDGLTAASDIVLLGGRVTVTAGGGAGSASATADASAKGIVAEAALVIDAGIVQVDAADDALHSNGILTVSGGELLLAASDDGVHADTDLTITGGQVTVAESYEGLESTNMTISGGALDITATDDGINVAGGDGSGQAGPGDQQGDFGGGGGQPGAQPGGGGAPGGFEEAGDYHLLISGGELVIDSGGDGLDSNGTAEMTGGTVVVHGPTSGANGAIDVNGTFEISGGTLVAAGSAGMAEAPEETSTQAWVGGTFATAQPAGTVIAFEVDGTVLATFTATKEIQAIVYSGAQLVAGGSVDVFTGATPDGDSLGGLTTSGSTEGAELVGTTTTSGGSA